MEILRYSKCIAVAMDFVFFEWFTLGLPLGCNVTTESTMENQHWSIEMCMYSASGVMWAMDVLGGGLGMVGVINISGICTYRINTKNGGFTPDKPCRPRGIYLV